MTIKTYHLEFDHPDCAHLRDTHYERFADAVAAHDRLIGLPNGATRVVDDAGLVHAVLFQPPVESYPEPTDVRDVPGVMELTVKALKESEATGEFDADDFFVATASIRHNLDRLEQHGLELARELARRPHSPSCCIVDDEPAVRRAIERMARAIGFDVVMPCSSVSEFRRLCLTGPGRLPDVVVCDYNLPDGTGVDVQAIAADGLRSGAALAGGSVKFVRTQKRSYTNLGYDPDEPVYAAADTVLFLDNSPRAQCVLEQVMTGVDRVLVEDPDAQLIIADSWDSPEGTVTVLTLKRSYRRDADAIHPEFARFEQALQDVKAPSGAIPLGIFTPSEWWVGFLEGIIGTGRRIRET